MIRKNLLKYIKLLFIKKNKKMFFVLIKINLFNFKNKKKKYIYIKLN